MTGKSHVSLGFAVGASMVIFAVGTKQPEYAFGMLSAPIGSLFPDIDHNKTKIGRIRKTVFDALKKLAIVIPIMVVALVGLLIYLGYLNITDIIGILLVVFAISGLILIIGSDHMKEKHPFLYKHRNIMHTLLVVIAAQYVGSVVSNLSVSAILIGFAGGYLSHLYSDSLTITGLPLAWPLSQEDVSFGKVVTGKASEIVAAVFCFIAVIVYGVIVTIDQSQLPWIAFPFIVAFAHELPGTLVKKMSPKTRSFFLYKKPYIIMVLSVLGIILFFHDTKGKVISLGIMVGFIKKCISRKQVKRKVRTKK